MATGWAHEGAVQEQIDASVKDAIERARSRLPTAAGPDGSPVAAATHCADCGAEIPSARRAAMPGVHRCLPCQELADRTQQAFSGYNRRGSKDSQLR